MIARSFPITAYAVCSALGFGRQPTLVHLQTGHSGLAPCAELAVGQPALPFATYCGQVSAPLAPLPPQICRHDTRITRLAAQLYREIDAAVGRARRRWGDRRIGLFIGTSVAGIDQTEQAYGYWQRQGALPSGYDFADQHAYHSLVSVLRALSGVDGPALVLSTACSSSGKAFASAQRALRADLIDAAIVGGVDVLCQTTLRGFKSLSVLAEGPCRPFCAERQGISIGEGGALCLLERSGDGPFRLLGVGETSDAHHMSTPLPDGDGARDAMEQALAAAGLPAGAVDHINAHGTATRMNDLAEGKAIFQLFADRVPVVSTKAYTGHLLGAASAVEAVLAGLCLEEGWIPPNLGLAPKDPEIQVQLPSEGRRDRVDVVLSNSFAFGGNNVSLLLGTG